MKFRVIGTFFILKLHQSSNIGTDRALFSGRRRAAQGRRIIKNSGRRIIKNSGWRIIIRIRHNYMHDVTRAKSGGVRRRGAGRNYLWYWEQEDPLQLIAPVLFSKPPTYIFLLLR